MWALTLGSGEWTQLWGPPGAVLTHWTWSCKLQVGDKTNLLLNQSGGGMERYSKWDQELEERAHVQGSVQNTQSEHGGSRHLKCGDGVPASGVHHIRRTILPKRSYMDHWRELHKNKNKNSPMARGSWVSTLDWRMSLESSLSRPTSLGMVSR